MWRSILYFVQQQTVSYRTNRHMIYIQITFILDQGLKPGADKSSQKKLNQNLLCLVAICCAEAMPDGTTDKPTLWLLYATEAENVMRTAVIKPALIEQLFRHCAGGKWPVMFVNHVRELREKAPTATWLKSNAPALQRANSPDKQVCKCR